MRQTSFVDGSFKKYHKRTRKEQFLAEMETIIPWQELTAIIAPHYPQPQGCGTPTHWCRTDAAHLLYAALVQSLGPGGRRGALRHGIAAPVCRN